jgi:hypothetical protein
MVKVPVRVWVGPDARRGRAARQRGQQPSPLIRTLQASG